MGSQTLDTTLPIHLRYRHLTREQFITLVAGMSVDDILDLPEPWQTWARVEFLSDNEGLDEGILIKSTSRKPMTIVVDGRKHTFPASGKRLSRPSALYVLELWGKRGQYRGKDQATGFSKKSPTSEVAFLKQRGAAYNDDYLYHAVEGQDEPETPVSTEQ